MTILESILLDVWEETREAQRERSEGELRAMIADAPPVRPFVAGLRGGALRLIAEIKERSPSVGAMLVKNVGDAALAYEESGVVAALSVLTNEKHFGGSIEKLAGVRGRVSKPVLRKDFIVCEYQIYEARAFGADAILLMANVLDEQKLRDFHAVAQGLGMAVLFEVHEEEEIGLLPKGAEVVGINSRKFRSEGKGFAGAGGYSSKDFSVDLGVFGLAEKLPAGCVKVAESGVSAETVTGLAGVFDAVLVGTSLLRDERGVRAHLMDFEKAIGGGES